MKRILYFVSLAAWLRFRHSKLTAGGEGRVRILAIECVIECCWPIFARPDSPFDELERFFFSLLSNTILIAARVYNVLKDYAHETCSLSAAHGTWLVCTGQWI